MIKKNPLNVKTNVGFWGVVCLQCNLHFFYFHSVPTRILTKENFHSLNLKNLFLNFQISSDIVSNLFFLLVHQKTLWWRDFHLFVVRCDGRSFHYTVVWRRDLLLFIVRFFSASGEEGGQRQRRKGFENLSWRVGVRLLFLKVLEDSYSL